MTMDASFYKSEIRPGLYRHYKGKTYRVFSTVTHSETEEVLVLYAPEGQTRGEARLWVRPLSMFIETVTISGSEIPRFALIAEDTGN